MGVERFEDLKAWQLARTLTKEIYLVTNQPAFARGRALTSQIQRAAVSIMSNIAEGFERGGLSEFHQFLSISKASCAELRSQLYIAQDVGYISQAKFDQLKAQAEQTARVIGGLRASVERLKNQKRGN